MLEGPPSPPPYTTFSRPEWLECRAQQQREPISVAARSGSAPLRSAVVDTLVAVLAKSFASLKCIYGNMDVWLLILCCQSSVVHSCTLMDMSIWAKLHASFFQQRNDSKKIGRCSKVQKGQSSVENSLPPLGLFSGATALASSVSVGTLAAVCVAFLLGGLRPPLLEPAELPATTPAPAAVPLELDLAKRLICPACECPECARAPAGWDTAVVFLAVSLSLVLGCISGACIVACGCVGLYSARAPRGGGVPVVDPRSIRW